MSEQTAKKLIDIMSRRGQNIVFAESCTAGLLADSIASIPGASKALWGSFVCYTVEAKEAMLGIEPALIEREGAVSGETAKAMARGALEKSRAVFAASVTGLAGPDGDERGTPVGTVWIGIAARKGSVIEASARRFLFTGDRQLIRKQAAETALELLAAAVEQTA